MKQEVIKELSTADLHEHLDEHRKQLLKMKLNHAVSPLENPNKIKAFRRTIARLMTEIRKRQIETGATNK
ncbi:MAG: 50S ribosomal protein L29 [Bacteroidales bacterium]|jgi:large subunit ribosomal protein L29|nr:50S ribosomal protein L29 [Bacteroidales bacterium]MCK9449199.1 50S ribosomal protein L29 [Bacteroidales bacterium]MDD3701763.1 50S ribosomal protein L29 [Bacteroidales bacterium]MDY0370144.1 50S ribosomal protein L29 [Bacteroidales bacterium]